MPRHDPLSRCHSGHAHVPPPFETAEQEIEVLRDMLRGAERILQTVMAERDNLVRQLLQAGIRPRIGPRKRKPPEAGLAVPAVPPRGPMPLQGGAEAPLDFSG